MDPTELDELASYRDPSEPILKGINALRTDSSARAYRVIEDGAQFSLFAAVHPIEVAPESAEILADILDASGQHYSYVLWFPDTGSIVVPFDPNAAVEAFWHEAYLGPQERSVLPQPILGLYYRFLKRALPASVKFYLRELMVRRADGSKHFLEWPTDRSLDLLRQFLLRLVLLASGRQQLRFAWFWPDAHRWAAVLTHDVETAAGLAQVPRIAEMEQRRGLRSSFNLVPFDYEVPGSLLRSLDERGFEIGVHGSTHDGLLFSKWTIFLNRVVAINECGRRWGSAGFRSPSTYRNQEWFHLLGFEYDSSVTDTTPYEPQPGGCASLFPYPLGGLIEMPITMPQDHTLFALLGKSDAETWLTKLEQIREANGMACMLTHPDPARGYIGLAENRARYAEVLAAVIDSDAWVPLPRDLVRWWRDRAAQTPQQTGNTKGLTFGTAQLNSSGHLEILPPALS